MASILGISAFYHDAAAALVIDGEIVAAAQEERFTRKKHDNSFPRHAIDFCLAHAGLGTSQLDHVGFYEKPLLKFDRQIETYLSYAPSGFRSFRRAVPAWTGKLNLRREIRRGLGNAHSGRVCFCEHHESHAASAFFPSPFEQAAILTMDGVGEWATTTLGTGNGNRIELTDEIPFPHSIGLLYSAFTYFAGFAVNSGEYKLMGLAPFGEPRYADVIRDRLITIHDDGSFRLDLQYFNYCQGLTMTSARFHELFGRGPRRPRSPIQQLDMDMAASVQQVTEEVVLKSARHLHAMTGMDNLCMAGGVALNCVANGRLLREGPFENIWIQPAAGDAGGALGVAMLIWHQLMDRPRAITLPDHQSGSLLGPAVDTHSLAAMLDRAGAVYECIDDRNRLAATVAKEIADGRVVGRVQGPMEFGPRALGNRSILADPRRPDMQDMLNRKIKFRESFRPFAPIVLAERAREYFELPANTESPYMLLVCDVATTQRCEDDASPRKGLDRIGQVRSSIPAVTHVDHSARVQTVDPVRNPALRDLLAAFERHTGCPVLVNTSLNVRDEPIVCTAADAIRCFMNTEMDVLVIENYLLRKEQQSGIDLGSLAADAPVDRAERRQLAWFSLSLVLSLGLVATIAFTVWNLPMLAGVLGVTAIGVGVLAIAVPKSRFWIREVVSAITWPIRLVATVLVLGIVYLGMVTPIGMWRRRGGHSIRVADPPGWKSRERRVLGHYFHMY